MSAKNIWDGGLPTGPDVRKLNDAFPSMAVGTVITYSQIGDVIGNRYPDKRFDTVLRAWRRDLQERGIVTLRPPRVGIKVASNSEAIGLTHGDLRYVERKVRRTARRLKAVRPEGERESQDWQHALRLTTEVARATKAARKELIAPNVVQLPRPKPPKAG